MAGAALDRVLQRLQGVKACQGYWKARCPAHEDHVASLQVSERADLSVGLHCHAGCDKQAILASAGLKFADLYTDTSQKTIVSTYDYRDLDGKLLYQSVRYFPKDFRQRRPDPAAKDGWAWNMLPFKGKQVVYRLNDLRGHNTAVVVEGEKDADRLWACGIPATCNVGGAEKWGQSETKSLVKAGVSRVVIIPDNDDPGRRHAERVAKSVQHANLQAEILELDHLPPHGDVSDWLMNGGSPEALMARINAPYFVVGPPPTTPTAPASAVPEPAPPVVPPDALPDPIGYPQTQLGAAEALRDRYGDRLRYDHLNEQWYIWDEHRWRPDTDEAVTRLAMQHARKWAHEVIGANPDYLNRKKWQDFTLKLEKRSELVSMVTTARALEPITVGANQWNLDPWLLGCPNGIVDLRNGTIRSGVPTDGISQQTGAPFDPSAQCPRWLTFLDEVFEGDLGLIDFVHKALGYSLTGDMREQVFFLCIGTGSNGKSIFLNLLEHVWGSYAQRSAMSLFIGEVSEYHMADLVGSRMVFASESKKDTRINEHVLKSLTGGETQKAARKYGHPFTFRPIGKIWLAVNDPPKVMDDSYGFWRRLRLIPFDRTFTGPSDDRTLRDRLMEEAPGILAWCIRGVHEWLHHGLSIPPSMVTATDEYQTQEDPLNEFLHDRCKIDPDASETFSALQQAYGMWADKSRIPKQDRLSRRQLGTLLKRRFATHDVEGLRRYRGLKLNQW